MQRCQLLLALLVSLSALFLRQTKKPIAQGTVHIRGAGATFPEPLYQKWCEEYQKLHPDVLVEYKAVGSGKGVERFLAGDVDFGASDGALTDEEIAKVSRGAQLIPATA